MSNAYTYEHMSEAERNTVDWLEPKDMLELLNGEDDVIFYRVHTVLCEMVKNKNQMNESQMECVMLPYRLWGSMAGYELYKIKKAWDDMKAIPTNQRKGYKYAGKNNNPF